MDRIDAFKKRRETRLAIKRFLERRQLRLDAKKDENWKTLKGAHVLLDKDGDTIIGGPKQLQGQSFKAIKKQAKKNSTEKNTPPKMEKIKRAAANITKAFRRLTKGSVFGKKLEATTQRTMAVANKYYEKAEKVINERPELRLYSNHTWEHIETVAKKSIEAAEVINNADLGDFYGKVDSYELHASALLHDTGMDGDSKSYQKTEEGDIALRKEHPMNSAIHVLENRDKLIKAGLDPDKIALNVLGHSKSMSGIKDLTDEKQWGHALRRIEDRINEYNSKVASKDRIKFDVSAWSDGSKDENGDYIITNKKQLGQTAATVMALRLGDANRDGLEEASTQGGCRLDIDMDSYDPRAKSAKEERESLKAVYTDNNGKKTNAGEGHFARTAGAEKYSVGVHAAENNITSMKTILHAGKVTEEITVKDPTKIPYLMGEAICERVGEMNTINGIPSKILIKVPGIRKGSRAAEDYKEKVSWAWESPEAKKKGISPHDNVEIQWEFDE